MYLSPKGWGWRPNMKFRRRRISRSMLSTVGFPPFIKHYVNAWCAVQLEQYVEGDVAHVLRWASAEPSEAYTQTKD